MIKLPYRRWLSKRAEAEDIAKWHYSLRFGKIAKWHYSLRSGKSNPQFGMVQVRGTS